MTPSTDIKIKKGLLVLGNHLFPIKEIKKLNISQVFMCEHKELASYYKFHKHKIILFLSAMRHYACGLNQNQINTNYIQLQDSDELSYLEHLELWIKKARIDELLFFEIEDKFFETQLIQFLKAKNIKYTTLVSPLFLTSREQFRTYLNNNRKPFMKTFYEQQRRQLHILMDEKGKPVGGKWSFDHENRKKLPKSITIPSLTSIAPDAITQEVMHLVDTHFADHPGTSKNFWLPTTREESVEWFKKFIHERLNEFGSYQDAISHKDPFLFHSVISPMMNMGLLTPREVILYVLQQHKRHHFHYPAVEGFVRQVIGWREFVRGIYQNYSQQQETANFWNHHRKLKKCWYEGTTGLPILDAAIQKTNLYGYAHHIERLMIFSNLMTLCQVHPQEAYTWFMEMFVDSSDWVMGPNVYGMGLWSDGGLFATKPYICGSNYYLKMSDTPKGDWCHTVDGLYWSFIDHHKDKLSSNHRFGIILSQLKKIAPEMMLQHRQRAKEFIASVTESD